MDGGVDESQAMAAYERELAGWISPQAITGDSTDLILTEAITTADIYKISIPNGEYFLLENRQRTFWADSYQGDGDDDCDKQVPGTGLMISHIDPDLSSKTNQLWWLRANGGSSTSIGLGDETDPFKPGNKVQFTPWTVPNSDTRNGTSSSLAVTNIRESQSSDSIIVDIDLDFTSGEITEDSWWDGSLDITGDITVASGVTLTIDDNTSVDFTATSDDQSGGAYTSKAELIVNGELDADGSSGAITLDREGASGTWGGIQFNSVSSGTLTNATIDHVTKGIYVSGTDNVTIDDCTFQNFTEQAVYANNSSLTVKNSTIQNPSGASHGIYLLGGSSDPTIQDNTINSVLIGIERKDSPGNATISGNTFTNCRDAVRTNLSSPEIYNNYFDGGGLGDHGIRVQSSSSPDIHDNDFFEYTLGVWLEQGEPADLKWNNFGYTGGQTSFNYDAGLYIDYLTSGNTWADNKWNNFYDGSDIKDVHNNTSYTLKARGNYWDNEVIEGSADTSNPQSSHNSDAGPGGALGKFAQNASNEETEPHSATPEHFSLRQNFPNPFNPSTVISFRLPETATVTLTVYDVLGRHVRTLAFETSYGPGTHTLTWDGADDTGKAVASGVYVYRIKAVAPTSDFSASRKLVFVQ